MTRILTGWKPGCLVVDQPLDVPHTRSALNSQRHGIDALRSSKIHRLLLADRCSIGGKAPASAAPRDGSGDKFQLMSARRRPADKTITLEPSDQAGRSNPGCHPPSSQRAARFSACGRQRSEYNTNAKPNGSRANIPSRVSPWIQTPRIPLAPMRVFGLELQSRCQADGAAPVQASSAIARRRFRKSNQRGWTFTGGRVTRTKRAPPADRRLTCWRAAVHSICRFNCCAHK